MHDADKRPRVSFIIPTLDRRDALLRCLESVAGQEYPDTEIVVVDDSPSDESETATKAAFPQVRYLRNHRRTGLGPALAAGSRVVTGDIWVSLDDDGWLGSPYDADRIVRYFAEQPDLGAVAFKVEAPDGTVRRREIPLRTKKVPTEPTDIGYFNGGAVAFREECLRSVGGYPDVEYYAWEQEISFRFVKAGHRIVFAPDVRFIHEAIPSAINRSGRDAGYLRIWTRLAATYLPTPYAQVHMLAWFAYSMLHAFPRHEAMFTMRTMLGSLRHWDAFRSDRAQRLTLAETRKLTALSGRTWF